MLNQWHGRIMWFPLEFFMWATYLVVWCCYCSLSLSQTHHHLGSLLEPTPPSHTSREGEETFKTHFTLYWGGEARQPIRVCCTVLSVCYRKLDLRSSRERDKIVGELPVRRAVPSLCWLRKRLDISSKQAPQAYSQTKKSKPKLKEKTTQAVKATPHNK
jgi:hypothetical protein